SARLMSSNRRYIVMAMSLCLVGHRRLLRSRFRFCCYTQSRRNTTGCSNLEQISSCSFLHFSPLELGKYYTRIEFSAIKFSLFCCCECIPLPAEAGNVGEIRRNRLQ